MYSIGNARKAHNVRLDTADPVSRLGDTNGRDDVPLGPTLQYLPNSKHRPEQNTQKMRLSYILRRIMEQLGETAAPGPKLDDDARHNNTRDRIECVTPS